MYSPNKKLRTAGTIAKYGFIWRSKSLLTLLIISKRIIAKMSQRIALAMKGATSNYPEYLIGNN
jgi:hypothetical protein